MFEQPLLREHLTERNVKESMREAWENIKDAILRGTGYRLGGLTRDYKWLMECIYEHGEDEDLAAKLHAITAAKNQDDQIWGCFELNKWLEEQIEAFFPERLVEELAQDLERESDESGDEIVHKDRLLKEGRY